MKVAIIMGSTSDMPVMKGAINILKGFGIETHVDIVSAHRTQSYMMDFANTAHQKGIGVIIAGAGGAAHLPGMVAASSPLPVIGVPVKSRNSIDGWDSVLSILQMPSGVPVATVALDGAETQGSSLRKFLRPTIRIYKIKSSIIKRVLPKKWSRHEKT